MFNQNTAVSWSLVLRFWWSGVWRYIVLTILTSIAGGILGGIMGGIMAVMRMDIQTVTVLCGLAGMVIGLVMTLAGGLLITKMVLETYMPEFRQTGALK